MVGFFSFFYPQMKHYTISLIRIKECPGIFSKEISLIRIKECPGIFSEAKDTVKLEKNGDSSPNTVLNQSTHAPDHLYYYKCYANENTYNYLPDSCWKKLLLNKSMPLTTFHVFRFSFWFSCISSRDKWALQPFLRIVCLLVAQCPSNMLVYLMDRSAQTSVCNATLR